MKVIVLTGGIASGKSEVSRILKGFGAPVIDADQIVHGILKRGKRVKKKLLDDFGPQVFQGEEVDRRALGKLIFSRREFREKLEKILHPQVKRIVSRKVRNLEMKGVKVVFLEIPLFFEAGWPQSPDQVWVVYSPPELQRERLKEKGLSSEEIEGRISAQLPWQRKLSSSSLVIENTGSLKDLEEKVRRALKDLKLVGD